MPEHSPSLLPTGVGEYLEAIYKLSEQGAPVPVPALAERLEVTPTSANEMVRRLVDRGLATYEPYRGVSLTDEGRRQALLVIRRHRLWERLLTDILHVPWDQVHEEACRLEHVISEAFEDKIFEALGRPTRDPHGEPIPTKDGKMPRTDHEPLSDLQPGAAGTISQVRKSNPEMLRYLGARGLIPEAAIEVVEKAPFEGPLTVRTGNSSYVLGRQLASHIRVEVDEGRARARRSRSRETA